MIERELAIFERIAVALETIAKEMQDGHEDKATLKDTIGMVGMEINDLRAVFEEATGVHICNHDHDDDSGSDNKEN